MFKRCFYIHTIFYNIIWNICVSSIRVRVHRIISFFVCYLVWYVCCWTRAYLIFEKNFRALHGFNSYFSSKPSVGNHTPLKCGKKLIIHMKSMLYTQEAFFYLTFWYPGRLIVTYLSSHPVAIVSCIFMMRTREECNNHVWLIHMKSMLYTQEAFFYLISLLISL
jgi:hypothetical protein